MGILNVDLSATANLPSIGTLRAQVPGLVSAGTAFSEAVSDTATKWQALNGLYDTPHQHLVLNALTSPSRQAAKLAESTASIAQSIRTFADEVEAIRTSRGTLQAEISAADAELGAMLEDPEPAAGVTFQNTLLRYQWDFVERAQTLAADYEAARAACLTALTSVGRASTDVTSYYTSAVLDLVSHDAERLHRQAVSPGASMDDVQRYYDYLAGMDAARYREFAADYPEAAVYPPRLGLSAERQSAFWRSLSPEQQEMLAQALPAVVGNTEGVPYGIRAAANAAVLALVLKPAWRATEGQRDAYRNIRLALRGTSSKSPSLSLISFDPAEPPLAAVALGNMDTASSITVNVSGMGSSTQEMDSAVRVAGNLYHEQRMQGANPAVLAWIGYDSPDMPMSTEVLFSDKARTGGVKLATVLDGLYATRGTDNAPWVSVTAHSYGTTTAAFALTETKNTIDSVVFYGSAGIDPEAAGSAADLNVRSGEVYATQGRADKVAPLGIAGSQFGDPRLSPTSATWGAKVFSAEAASIDGEALRGNGGHGGEGTTVDAGITETELGAGYLDPDTVSLRQIAAASSGNGHGIELILQSGTDASIDGIKRGASNIYYAPGRAVDTAQEAAATAVDTAQTVGGKAADAVQSGFMSSADVLQERYLPGIGPVENPLNPVIDGLQRMAMDKTDAFQEQVNKAIDKSQSTVDTIVDAHQKAADEYFKRQWRAVEFVAGKLVAVRGTD